MKDECSLSGGCMQLVMGDVGKRKSSSSLNHVRCVCDWVVLGVGLGAGA